MNLNKWTLSLAAVGVVSLASAVKADDQAPASTVLTALSATTLSGYVDTSAEWNPGTGNANPAPYAFNAGKQDGFNLDSVDLRLNRPLDESEWAAGYTVELLFGPDSGAVTGMNGEFIREAHVDLRVPVGNGVQLQVGRFGNIIGYESTSSMLNPNYTHSYAWSMQPTEHTGILATYNINDSISLQVGVADTLTTLPINTRSPRGETAKTIVSLVTLTAPKAWGWLGGSAFYAGFDNGFGSVTENHSHLYLGATVNTPLSALKFGAEGDSVWNMDVNGLDAGYVYDLVGYATYQLTEKASLNLRGEFVKGSALGAMADAADNPAGYSGGAPVNPLDKVVALTGTLQYDLWKNVISRAEFRWDHNAGGGGPTFGGTVAGTPARDNEFMLAVNVIYKF